MYRIEEHFLSEQSIVWLIVSDLQINFGRHYILTYVQMLKCCCNT